MPISSPTLRRGARLTLLGLSLLALHPESFADEPLLPPPPDSAAPVDTGGTLPPEAGPAPTPEEMPTLAPPPDTAAAPPAEQPTAPLPPPTESAPVEAAPKELPKPIEKAAEEPPVEKPVVAPTPSPTPTSAAEAKPERGKEKAKPPVPTVSPTSEPEIQAAEPKAEPSPEPTAEPAPVPSVTAETPPAPEPSPEPSAAAAAASDSSSSRHHGQIPEYQKTKPQWAFEFIGSPSALGTDDISNDFTGHPIAYDLHFEFQPAFLQAIGVIGFGPTVGLYMFPADQNISASPASVWTVGFEGRYQARFFREQLIVPVVGYAAERINYHFQTGGGVAGSVIVEGPVFGLWLLLNRFEPGVAEEMFKQNGVSRSYAVVEARDLEGSDDYLSISGFSFFFGLRIEF